MYGKTVTITPGGYAFLNKWGSARYNTATQFVALVYDNTMVMRLQHTVNGQGRKWSTLWETILLIVATL